MNQYLVQAVVDAAGELHALAGESQRELVTQLEAVALYLLELDRRVICAAVAASAAAAPIAAHARGGSAGAIGGPIMVGLVVIGIVFLIITVATKWSWAKPIAVLCFVALIVDSLVQCAG